MGGWGGFAKAAAEMSEDKSLVFQNNLAFPSVSVCERRDAEKEVGLDMLASSSTL